MSLPSTSDAPNAAVVGEGVSGTAFKPKKSVALSGTPAGNTALCTVGRNGNELHYRGYNIMDLAASCVYEEVAYLLIHGKLPNRAELQTYREKLTSSRGLPAIGRAALELLPAATHPMDVLRTYVAALGCVQAAAGQLLFLAGGSVEAVSRITPILKVMGRDVVHVGPVGSGARLKLINNFLSGSQVAGLAEALALIERSGLDRQKALSVLTEGAPGSPLVKLLSGRMTERKYEPQFLLRLMAKDLRYAVSEADQQGLDLDMGRAALRVFEHAIDAGQGKTICPQW